MSQRFQHLIWADSKTHELDPDCQHQWSAGKFGRKCSSCEGVQYEILQDTETGDLSCQCAAWRFQHLPTNERDCKHTKPLQAMSDKRLQEFVNEVAARPTQSVGEAELVDLLAAVETSRAISAR